jgi:hypothetical protein
VPWRQRVADPDFWLSTVAWTVVALSGLQIVLFSFGRDQGIYAVVGEGILRGKMPYRDLWDFKPPGIFVVYGLAQAWFGHTMVAPRLLEVAGLVGAVFALQSLAHSLFGMRRVGLVGGALAAMIHAQMDFWHTGQPEAFGGFLTIFAMTLTVRDTGQRRAVYTWAGIGLLFGAAFLLKPPLGGGALVCAAYLARREWVRTARWRAVLVPIIAVGLSSVAPLLLCALWFKAAGAWPAFRWTFAEFIPGYTALGWDELTAPAMFYHALMEAFFRFSALAAFGVIAAIAIPPMYPREREGLLFVLGVIAIHLIGITMQGKFFQYHYTATLPLISFIAGLGLYKLWRRSIRSGAGGVIAFASFVVVAALMRQAVNDLPGSFWHRSLVRMEFLLGEHGSSEQLDSELYYLADYKLDTDRRVAMELDQRTAPGASVYVWGFEPGIYWLSRREPASRFIYDVPQRVKWQRDTPRRELMEDLLKNPPAMIVVAHNDVFPSVTGDDVDSAHALEQFPDLQKLLDAEYGQAARIEDFDLYQRKAR